MKVPLLFLGFFLTLSTVSQAGPARAGFSGHSFHSGFVGRGLNSAGFHGGRFNGAGFQGRFFRRNRPVFVQSYAWPGYWYPYTDYTDPLAYSYLEPDSDSGYQYWDNSQASVRPEAANRAVPQSPVIVVINNGNARPTNPGVPIDPRGNVNPRGITDPRGDGGYVDNSYISTRTVVPDPNEHTGADTTTPGDAVVPQSTPGQNTQTLVPTGTGPFRKFVVVSWLKDGEKDVISVKNIETNAVQRITSQPNIDHFRIVEIHPNPDLKQFEAIISNGSDQGPVRFQF